jgi:hypothetical protein
MNKGTLLHVERVDLVRPSIHNFRLSETVPGISVAIDKWGWVSLNDLIKCLSPKIELKYFYEWFNEFDLDIFGRFGHMTHDDSGVPQYTYIAYHHPYEADNFPGSYELFLNSSVYPKYGSDHNFTLYVPALWSNNIIDLVAETVVRVRYNHTHRTMIGNDSVGKKYLLTKQGKCWLPYKGLD